MPPEGPALPKLESRFRRFLAELDNHEGCVAGHSAAVCRSALGLARALGVAPADVRDITLGALVHDIGKVFVDARVLGKPTPLTCAEVETMRLHPLLGEALLT